MRGRDIDGANALPHAIERLDVESLGVYRDRQKRRSLRAECRVGAGIAWLLDRDDIPGLEEHGAAQSQGGLRSRDDEHLLRLAADRARRAEMLGDSTPKRVK